METEEQVPTHYLSNLLDLVDSLRGSSAELLEKVGIDPDVINDPDRLITLKQYVTLLSEMSEVSGEPAFGLLLGSRMNITSHGSLGFAAMSSPTVGDAVTLAAQFIKLRTPLISIDIERSSDKVIVRLTESDTLSGARRTYLETVMSALTGALRFISSKRFVFDYIAFSFDEPEYSSLYQGVFDCPVKFGQRGNEAVFSESQMSMPILMYDKDAYQQAMAQCEQEIAAIQTDMASKIKQQLRMNKGPFPSLEQIAVTLNMTSRTLRRRLSAADTSFQEILDDVRNELAVNYLLRTDLSVAEIAFFLGYNDPSNFGRAFKKWEGVSPNTYRQVSGH